MIQDSCTCGATIKLASLDADEDADTMAYWQGKHVGEGHAAVRPHVANLIRNYRMTPKEAARVEPKERKKPALASPVGASTEEDPAT